MNEWSGTRIAMVVGLSALAVTVALAVDQGDAASAGAASTSPGSWREARVTTSTTALFASPTVHATENGKCVRSSPDC